MMSERNTIVAVKFIALLRRPAHDPRAIHRLPPHQPRQLFMADPTVQRRIHRSKHLTRGSV